MVEVAALVGDTARATMLAALMDGQSLTATELAYAASISRSTASEHLARLVNARLLVVTRKRRFAYYRIASPLVAGMLESIKLVAAIETPPRHRPRSARDDALCFARTCYDHLAGQCGVAITDALVKRGHLVLSDEGGEVTPPAKNFWRRLASISCRGRAAGGCSAGPASTGASAVITSRAWSARPFPRLPGTRLVQARARHAGAASHGGGRAGLPICSGWNCGTTAPGISATAKVPLPINVGYREGAGRAEAADAAISPDEKADTVACGKAVFSCAAFLDSGHTTGEDSMSQFVRLNALTFATCLLRSCEPAIMPAWRRTIPRTDHHRLGAGAGRRQRHSWRARSGAAAGRARPADRASRTGPAPAAMSAPPRSRAPRPTATR